MSGHEMKQAPVVGPAVGTGAAPAVGAWAAPAVGMGVVLPPLGFQAPPPLLPPPLLAHSHPLHQHQIFSDESL